MEVILVRDIYTVDTISKGNARAWNKLMEYMDGQAPDADILFDFKGIEVVQPWSTNEFKKFMQDSRVHIKLWGAEQTVNSINIMCSLNGIKGERAINEAVIAEKVPTKEEKQIANMAVQLQDYFNAENPDYVEFQIHRRFDQIGVPITVQYIEAAIYKYLENHDCKKIKINFKRMVIQVAVVEHVANLVNKFGDVEIEVYSEDEETAKKLEMYRSLAGNKSVPGQEKMKIIKARLYPGKVGMLIKYKDSKAVDEFGRKGKGKPVSCRVSIFKGMKKNKDGFIVLCFTTYSVSTFFTKIHWALEHDNEILDALDTKEEEVMLDEFGMYNDFLGSKYHWITPVQVRPDDTCIMFDIEDGKVVYLRMTIPERIKAVFDDYEVEYDKEGLEKYIEETKKRLESFTETAVE